MTAVKREKFAKAKQSTVKLILQTFTVQILSYYVLTNVLAPVVQRYSPDKSLSNGYVLGTPNELVDSDLSWDSPALSAF